LLRFSPRRFLPREASSTEPQAQSARNERDGLSGHILELCNLTKGLVVLPDGRAVIATSTSGGGAQRMQGVVIFDPVAGTMSPFMPFAVAGESANSVERLLDGRGLFIRGLAPTPADLFSPAPDSFTASGVLNHLRGIDLDTAVLLDGRVLVVGGAAETSVPAEVYDPATGLFTVAGAQRFYARRYGRAVTLASGRVLVVGGGDIGYGTPWAELFDPIIGSFAATGGMRRARWAHTATALQDGRVLVVGGCNMQPCEAELYTP